MDVDQAIAIVQKLADGVDPTTRERIPSSSVYQQADTGRAPHLTLEGLDRLKRVNERVHSGPPSTACCLPTQAIVRIRYDASDPSQVPFDGTNYSATGSFRLWMKNGPCVRDPRSCFAYPAGDYIPPCTNTASNLGFTDAAESLAIYVEPITPSANSSILFEVDPDGPGGTRGFVKYAQIKSVVLKVDAIDVTSPKSGTSVNPPPNPPPFTGHMPWLFDVTHSPTPDKHMVVFYKDVVDSSFNVQDFDVTLTANILPSSITADMLSEVWSKISGPASGSLNQADTFEVKYQNPKLGGVYRFDFDLGLSGCAKSEANVVLPLAGAEVDGIVNADIERADTFAATVIARYHYWQRQWPPNGVHWFVANGAGDYLGRPNNSSSPTVWAYNQVDANGFAAVGTWKGKPIRVAKISNFMVGYATRKIGVNSVEAWMSQGIGTGNDSSASKSWDAGWNVGGGASYDTTVTALVADIWDEDNDPNHKNMRLWPNTSATDNYIAPDNFCDPDHQFISPGFLYMTNP